MVKKLIVPLIVCAVVTLGLTACSRESSVPSAPTSTASVEADAASDGSTLKVTAPSVQTPVSGATIDSTTPNLIVTPAEGRFADVGALVYRFAVETEGGSDVYRSEAVSDVSDGFVAHRVAEGGLAWGTAYRWRARAEQGALAGPWIAFATFRTPAEPAPPTLDEPDNGSTVAGVAPNLAVKNGAVPAGGALTGLVHRFVVETTAGAVLINATAVAGSSATTFEVPEEALQQTTTYRWRARAERGTAFIGPWSPYWTFTTAEPITWPTTPAGIVGYVANEYPEYLVATSSLHAREENMRFLRDRIIEVGICGGFDLAWNLKRGVGPRSTDAILHRDGGRDRVIDIAAGFDDYHGALSLHWVEVAGPPGYDRYSPRPSCK